MVVQSPWPPVELPNSDLWNLLFEEKTWSFHREKPIYIDARWGRSYTWAETKATALDFGYFLRDVWKWGKGDVLALFSPNCIDSPAIIFGTFWAGGTVTAANPLYTVEELTFQLRNSGANALVTQAQYLSDARKAADLAGIPESRIMLIGDRVEYADCLNRLSKIRGTYIPERYQRPLIDPKQDLACLAYSSGTTGLPKAVMLSHENMVANLIQIELTDEGNLDSDGDKILAVVPYYHIYGFTCLVCTPAYRGLTTVVIDRYETRGFLKAIQKFRPTYANLVPPIILELAKSSLVEEYDISSLKMVMCGAAPLTAGLVNELYRKHEIRIRQVYGLTETSPVALVQRWDSCRDHVGSVGNLLPSMCAKICNEQGKEETTGLTGELYLKGPNIFKGYLNNEAATSGCLDADGWFRTGDVGNIDQTGNFFITNRLKELIKYKGFQVAPAELEGILLGYPSIMDVAVIGVFSEEHASELPCAYVVLSSEVEPSTQRAKDIILWLQERVAPHKRLRGGVEFVQSIPKNPSGKILRRLLRDVPRVRYKQDIKAKI